MHEISMYKLSSNKCANKNVITDKEKRICKYYKTSDYVMQKSFTYE